MANNIRKSPKGQRRFTGQIQKTSPLMPLITLIGKSDHAAISEDP
jgi:hypothetical protein